MSFTVVMSEKNYTYELGDSSLALNAVQSLESYKMTGNYGELKNCFANLSWLVSADPGHKIAACKACHALAAKVLNSYSDIYRKAYIANCVSSICINAEIPCYKTSLGTWEDVQSKYGKMIYEQGLDIERAKEAGLATLEI